MKRNLALAVSLGLAAQAAWSAAQALKTPVAQKPALLTSVGQSADVEMVKLLLERAGVPHKVGAQAKASELAASGARTLIVVVGGSTKGLGAAGISAEAELERSRALLAEARRLGMAVIGLHVGGEARRGELSDKFIRAVIPDSDYVIVVASGDKDGLFGKLCGGRIPLEKVERISGAVDPLRKAFQ
jgi:hypothetical protein